MIREDRDPAFWARIGEHAEVKPHVGLGRELDFSAVTRPEVTPLRSENGGFLFVRLDCLGRVQELHTLYLPQGWGREVAQALKLAIEEMFARGAVLITTFEVEGNWRSRPPKTFRFAPAGNFALAEGVPHQIRTWFLTRDAWEASPARQRM